ncbi:MAG: hypothetical protein ABI193_25390 [Minicystis sp.]
MPQIRFDPSKAVTFDLASGLVQLSGAAARLLVPIEALSVLCEAAGPNAAATFGRAVGEAMGARVKARLEGESAVNEASVEAMVEQIGGELGLGGMGSLSLERWGKAMVLVIDGSPLGPRGDGLLEAVLAGALDAATGRSVRSLLLEREEGRARFLITGDAGLEKVTSLLADGLSWGEALARLHASPARQASSASSRGDA